MAVVGVVLRLAGELSELEELAMRLRDDVRVTLGPSLSQRLALTLEGSSAELSEWMEEAGRWPGVLLVSPVFHSFEDEHPGDATPTV